MTQDEINAMARMAGATEIGHKPPAFHFYLKDLEAFVQLVERRKCQELADKIELLPFGDTASSFAAWVRSEA